MALLRDSPQTLEQCQYLMKTSSVVIALAVVIDSVICAICMTYCLFVTVVVVVVILLLLLKLHKLPI